LELKSKTNVAGGPNLSNSNSLAAIPSVERYTALGGMLSLA